MEVVTIASAIFLVIIFLVLLALTIRICPEYMRYVKFRLGRYVGVYGPGVVIVLPIIERVTPIDLRVTVVDLPAQKAITRDNVEVTVDATVYFRVIKPEDVILKVQNYKAAVAYLAAATLRDVIGMKDLDTLLSRREEVAQEIARIVDEYVQEWGIKVTSVVMKDIRLPEGLVRAMAQAAEAERTGRAKVILAEADLKAAEKYLEAAKKYAQSPVALMLRQIDALIEIAREKSLIVVTPSTLELTTLAPAILRYYEKRGEEKRES